MTARRKPVTAWAVVDECNWIRDLYLTEELATENTFKDQNERTVKLTEADPLARYDAAVLRAVRGWYFARNGCDRKLASAFERREKARGKRK